MKINFFLKKKNQKVELEENPKTVEELKQSIRKISEEEDDKLKISFVDIENEQFEIDDEHDFDYLIQNVSMDKKIEVKVEQQQDLTKEITSEKKQQDTSDNFQLISQMHESFDTSKIIENQQKNQSTQINLENSEQQIQTDEIKKKDLSTQTNAIQNSQKETQTDIQQEVNDHDHDGQKNFEISMIKPPLEREKSKKEQSNKKKIQKFDQTITSNQSIKIVERKLDQLQGIIDQKLGKLHRNLKKSKISTTNQKQHKIKNTIHYGITCDNCCKSNFNGNRYKCTQCEDFDLCETCENKNVHDHPMIRFKKTFVQNRQLDALISLNKLYDKNSLLEKDALKIKILKNLTDKKYPQEFYSSMLKDFKDHSVENFVLEMVKIFA